jgi:glycosyltransferase involved in cell wall biosynthesis
MSRTDHSFAARFCAVVPFYNEERGMHATLDALAAQSDTSFALILVDNASTDGSAAIAERFAREHSSPRTYVIQESRKGTGAASDTGFRFAISLGARWIARTDADCVPDRDWVRNLKRALCLDGLDFVAGKIRPRTDEAPLSLVERAILASMIWLAEHYGRLHRRGPQFKYPYFMAAGNNLAITAALYELSGGFPRTAIEEMHEDRALSEVVRTLTTRAAVRRDVQVYNSARRVRSYGYLNTLRWYRNHGYHPRVVDVR